MSLGISSGNPFSSGGITGAGSVGSVGGVTTPIRTAPPSNTGVSQTPHDTVSFSNNGFGTPPENRFGNLSSTTTAALQQNEAGLNVASQPDPGVVALAQGLGIQPQALGFNA
jgi:hypothetical protein